MDLGLLLPRPPGGPGWWEATVALVRRAESAGLASVWVSEHLAPASGGVDALVTLAGLARVTTRVRVGTLVLAAPLRPPGVMAKALATIDRLSEGRLTIGLGAGGVEQQFRAAGVAFGPPGRRLGQLDEAVHILDGAFSGEPFTFAGRHYHVEGMRCRPSPAQRPRPPVWIGGRGPRLLGVVARRADGWNAEGWQGSVADHQRLLSALARACEGVGRDPASVACSLNRSVLMGENEADLHRRWERAAAELPAGTLGSTLDDYRRGRLVGTPEQVREQVAAWAQTGVTTLIMSPAALRFAFATVDEVDLLAALVR